MPEAERPRLESLAAPVTRLEFYIVLGIIGAYNFAPDGVDPITIVRSIFGI